MPKHPLRSGRRHPLPEEAGDQRARPLGEQPLGEAGAAPPWHAREVAEVLEVLGTSTVGLEQEEAARRLREHGRNELPTGRGEGAVRRFLRQFDDVLIYVLLAAALITALQAEWLETWVILAVVLINTFIGFLQEGKAAKALESIRGMLSTEAMVRRDRRSRQIPASELVPGDIVLLESGNKVPADLRIISEKNSRVEEASLTGESEPVVKGVEPVKEDTPLADRHCMAYSSTVMAAGRVTGVVVATGGATEIGRIGAMVEHVEELTTPLLVSINRFGKRLAAAIVVLAGLVFLAGYLWRGFSISEIFLIVVGLAVAAIPEGLPAIITITLALGVQRMARRNALIRRLPAVETLGSVTVICSDKTGTLTRSEMGVREIVLAAQAFEATGTGYSPDGQLERAGKPVNPEEHPVLLELCRAGLLCSDAELVQRDDSWAIAGDPTEGAVVVLGLRAGLSREQESASHPRLDHIPFESERRYMATLHEGTQGSIIYLKGAPERVLELVERQRLAEDDDVPLDRERWEREAEELAGKGYRVLALATRGSEARELSEESLGRGLTLLGFVGIIDPPRPDAVEAVAKCQGAGIQVKMITGDHATTARSIGAQMGIGDGTRALSGKELEKLEDEELDRLVLDNDVFARSSPEHKLRLVEALQRQQHVVAMTGDGVNDTPALKRAHIGVAMGIKGSEAARDAAEMVLVDDNFASIERAVEEGRTVYDNLRKTILFILPTNGAEALIVIATVLFAFDMLPITPLQILWVNMVTAVTLAISLAFDPAEEDIMHRPPRPPDQALLSRYMVWRITFVSVVIATLAILLFFRQLAGGLGEQGARTLAVNVLVAGELFYLFNTRHILGSSLNRSTFTGNRVALLTAAILILLQLMFTYLPPLQLVFGTSGLRPEDWAWVVGAGLLVFAIVEAEKALVRRRGGRLEQGGSS